MKSASAGGAESEQVMQEAIKAKEDELSAMKVKLE